MTVRIGVGAGFASDRIDPAQDLAARGALDFLVFECLAERTLAYGHLARKQDASKGYNKYLERRLDAVLPACIANRTRIVTNMGVANVRAAGDMTLASLRRHGGEGLKVALIEGDDVTAMVSKDTVLPEIGKTVGDLGLVLVGANAYLGGEPIADALQQGADVVVAGRVADPSLFVGPLAYAFGWSFDDWQQLAGGTLVGHLLECSSQVTGGYFADPPHKSVPDLAFVGFPLAEVDGKGGAVITKLEQTGGLVSELTVKEQLLYEVHDPSAYLTPDVSVDFTSVTIEEVGRDRVAVSGAQGKKRPDKLKVTIGFEGGFLAEAEISYAGPGADGRAQLAADILTRRMKVLHGWDGPTRIDIIGQNSLHATALRRTSPAEDVRLRVAFRTQNKDIADALLHEMECLWVSGPAGGGGYRGAATPSIVTYATYIDRAAIDTRIQMVTA